MSSREAQIRGHFGKCVLTPELLHILVSRTAPGLCTTIRFNCFVSWPLVFIRSLSCIVLCPTGFFDPRTPCHSRKLPWLFMMLFSSINTVYLYSIRSIDKYLSRHL